VKGAAGAAAGGGAAVVVAEEALPVAELHCMSAMWEPAPFQQFQYQNYTGPAVGYASAEVEPGANVKPTGRRKALLVGCNYPGTSAELRGCVNDVHAMRDLLSSVGFPAAQMTILTDDGGATLPTRANIMRGFQWLVAGAQPGDVLFFHFSGHGSQQRDDSGMEEDGYNETICPCDYERSGQIVDDEIWSNLVFPLPSGVRLTALMDCCHSGTGLDLPFQYSIRAGRWFEDENPSHSRGDVQLFSGCQDDQCSSDGDVMLFKTGGAMTNAFIRAYKSSHSPLPYPEFLRRVHSELQSRGFSQKPQLSSSQAFNLSSKAFSITDGIIANTNPQVGRVQRRKIRPKRNFGTAGLGMMDGLIAGAVGLSLLDAIF